MDGGWWAVGLLLGSTRAIVTRGIVIGAIGFSIDGGIGDVARHLVVACEVAGRHGAVSIMANRDGASTARTAPDGVTTMPAPARSR